MIPGSEHRIRSTHLEKIALIYIRQSSPDQVRNHTESARIQLDLREKAIALGWPHPVVIDDDLGVSASGYADRPGFHQMLTQVTKKEIGIIFCVEASRLSRNSKDWAHLFELCGFFGTLVADLDQVYDLSHPNDRLVLGIKGTVSEMELGTLRHRLQDGMKSKAKRGELRVNLPAGFSYDALERIVLDPDQRVQDAIQRMFDQFDRCTSIRQLGIWYRDTKTRFPVKKVRTNAGISWQIPTLQNLIKLLKHPIYAGVYLWGRQVSQIEYIDGNLRKRLSNPLPMEQCQVFIRDHHPAYISWERFLANQARINENKARWSMEQNRGAIRSGLALLSSGLCRCGHCGSKIYVQYKKTTALYHCSGNRLMGSAGGCLSFGSHLIDQAVSKELCRALQPLSIEAAIFAGEKKERQKAQELDSARLRVEAAQYEADRTFEQFNSVDPKNRLVTATLENRLNDKLTELHEAKDRLESIEKARNLLSAEQKTRLQKLASDFEQVWNHPKAEALLKKRILRSAIEEIVVTHQKEKGQLEVTIHWQGGVHTQIYVKKRLTPIGCKADPDLVKTVAELAQSLADGEIARILNMKKVETPTSLRWTRDRVREFRYHHHIQSVGGGIARLKNQLQNRRPSACVKRVRIWA